MNGLKLDHLGSKRPNDAPAARHGAEAHGERARKLDPQGHLKSLGRIEEQKRQRDNAHRFLRIVLPVVQRHKSRRKQLQPPEQAVRLAQGPFINHPRQRQHNDKADDDSEHGRQNHRNNDLLDKLIELNAVPVAPRSDSGAQQRSDERMGRA